MRKEKIYILIFITLFVFYDSHSYVCPEVIIMVAWVTCWKKKKQT